MSAATAATAAFAVLIKEAISNMPDSLNTKKEIDEYYKKAMKDINDKMKDEKKAEPKVPKAPKEPKEPKAPKEPKEPKEPKKRVKKAAKAKPAEVDADGNEIVKVKKPLNKYQMFIQQQRPKVKEDYPELSGEEIFTKIAELWKQHKEGADNKSDEKEIKKIDSDSDKIKKIDSDSEADKASDDANASDSGESESGNESEVNDAADEVDDADEVDEAVAPAVAVVATATPALVVAAEAVAAEAVAAVADKKANASGGKAPRKALSTKPAKAAK